MTTNPMEHGSGQPGLPLRRPYDGRLVAGVAAGLADYLDVDVTVVRLAIVVVTLFGGLGIPAYLAAWLLIPNEGKSESAAEELLNHPDGWQQRLHDGWHQAWYEGWPGAWQHSQAYAPTETPPAAPQEQRPPAA